MAKIKLSTGFSVEVKPTPLLGLRGALAKLEQPEAPEWELESAAGGFVKAPYNPPPPGQEPTRDQPEEYQMYQRWLKYLGDRAKTMEKERELQLRYALLHSVAGFRMPARRCNGSNWVLWLGGRVLDIVAAKLARQPVPPSDWEEKAWYFGLQWSNEVERRLAYLYSVVIGSTLDANLILAAAVLVGPRVEKVEQAKEEFFRNILAGSATEGIQERDTGGPDQIHELEAPDESSSGQPNDTLRVSEAG